MQRRVRSRLGRCSGVAVATALLVGCGGGGGGGATPSTSTGVQALSPEAARLLTIDLQALPDYTPQLPAYYTGLSDNGSQLPAYFASLADNEPAGTQRTPAIATLGRVLFHDRQLSVSGTIACASCHQQAVDFADTRRFSTGFDGVQLTTRHAMRLANTRFYASGAMFWDKRAPSVEGQAVMALEHPLEMGFDASHGGMQALLQRMQSLPYYPELFSAAFGTPRISELRLQIALGQFVRAMVSTHSRWDDAFAQVFDPTLPDLGLDRPLPGFTEQENRGRHLFMASRADGGQACAACHQPPSFALAGVGSNGLDAGETIRFKAPSLKNVGRSSAFMHDGRFSSLEQVIEHYSSGVQDGPALDYRLKTNDESAPLRPALSAEDKAALVAFLKTLSDPVLAADPRFSSPFRADAASSP